MKILMYTNTFLPLVGGAQLAVHNLAEGLMEEGHEVLVATFHQGQEDPVAAYRLKRLQVLRGAGRLGLTDVARRGRLLLLIRRWKPDIIHAHYSIPCGYDVAKLWRYTGIPWVLTCHGEDILKVPEISYGLRLDPDNEMEVTVAVQHAHGLVAVGAAVAREYLELGASSECVFRLPNPIAFEALAHGGLKQNARALLDLPLDMPIVLGVGRNHPVKGFNRLLEAMEQLKSDGVKIGCVIVGEGSGLLRSYAEQLGIDKQVHLFDVASPAGLRFLGSADRGSLGIETFFVAADIFAMPSLSESFGLVTIEAMASGLPIVAFEGPGTNDLVAAECGVLVPAADIKAFAIELKRYAEDADLRVRSGLWGKKLAAQYGRRVVARRHVDLYAMVSRREGKARLPDRVHSKIPTKADTNSDE
jgi:glycosyltransferase involved in cell wall biosynthesis